MCDLKEELHAIKCMIVGDSLTGKTHLFKNFTNQVLPKDYVPTVFDVYDLEVQSQKGCKLKLNLWDSAGLHAYDSVRPISYAHTDCFIICYSITNKESFENVCQRWIPEIRKHGDGPSVPIILVGMQLTIFRIIQVDLSAAPILPTKDDESVCLEKNKIDEKHSKMGEYYVTESQGKSMQEEIGAKGFYSWSLSSERCTLDIMQAMIDLAHTKKVDEDKPVDPIWNFTSPTVVFMGDRFVGKSSLLQACLSNDVFGTQRGKLETTEKFLEYYQNLVIDGCEYFLRFLETSCKTDDITIIGQADVLVLCYAINDPFSFQTAEHILRSKLKDDIKTPVILIGTKSDSKKESACVIPTADGESLKQAMNCIEFLECSIKKIDDISKVVRTIIDTIKHK